MILLMIASVSGDIASQRDLNPGPLSPRRQIVSLTMEGMKTVVPRNIETTGKIGKTYFTYIGENHKCLEILFAVLNLRIYTISMVRLSTCSLGSIQSAVCSSYWKFPLVCLVSTHSKIRT